MIEDRDFKCCFMGKNCNFVRCLKQYQSSGRVKRKSKLPLSALRQTSST